jgi:hypothetical protein
MSRFFVRFFALSALCAGGASGQGTFADIVYGECWQTTLTLVNMNTESAATVTLFFYGDNGSPLSAPVQGVGNVPSYQLMISPNGSQLVVLASTDPNYTEGWANMTTAGGVVVRGQAWFSCHHAGSPDFEGVVPMSTSGSTGCIVPLPPPANPVIELPFDNTTGQHVTSLAFANTTSAALAVPIEFDDQLNNPLVKDTLNLLAMNHQTFTTTTNYPQLAGTKGVLRIKASTANLTALGILTNPSGAFTTIMPVVQ